jgi:hypothetical protein
MLRPIQNVFVSVCIAIGIAVCVTRAQAAGAMPTGQAGGVLREVQEAVGPRGASLAVRSITLTGTHWTSQVVYRDMQTGASSVIEQSGALEIRLLLPDHFLDIRDNDRMPRRTGFSGDRALPSASPIAYQRARASCTRLVLGLLGRLDTLPGSEATRRDDDGAVIVSGPDGFNGALFLDTETRLPRRLVYKDRLGVLSPGPIKPSPQAQSASSGLTAGGRGPGDLEVTMLFENRRMVDDISVPFTVSWTANGIKLWEIRLTKVQINSPLTVADFGGR